MRRLVSVATRAAHAVARAYHLACARDDVRLQGLRTPLGVWFCEHCRLVLLDGPAWTRHAAAHAV